VVDSAIEFLLVGAVRPLDLSIQLRRTWHDIGMPDALVLDVPVGLGPEFVSIVRSIPENVNFGIKASTVRQP